MMIEMLQGKLHRATVTGAELNYEGSISIDPELYQAAGMRLNQKVHVLNINNGSRLTTYIINGKKGEVCLNGAAARMTQKNDKVIIVSYCTLTSEEAKSFKPAVVLLSASNKIKKII